MSRPYPAVLFGIFVAVIVVICGVQLAKGALYLGKHEGDTFHLMQILFRMTDGQLPHVDFVTPIGAMAFWPITLFIKAGFGVGVSFILGQALVACAALPAIWWAAKTRLTGLVAVLFGVAVLVLILALVHGEAERSVSLSMHYNRWAWAISFIVIVLAMLVPERTNHTIDGIIIGAGVFMLLMIKVTYVVAFAPAILVALALRKAWRTLGIAAITGVVLIALTTAIVGLGFWQAYVNNLIGVANSDVRPFPSGSLRTVIVAPAYMGASILLMLSIVLLRQARFLNAGLVLLLLMPAFFYVTYQNFANDPQWLLLLAVILLAHVPAHGTQNRSGLDLRWATFTAAALAFAMTAPTYINLAYSPFRHLAANVERQEPFFANSETHDDLFTARLRAWRTDTSTPLDISGTPLAVYSDIEEVIEQVTFQGETLPVCSLELGLVAWFQAIMDDLDAAGFAGSDKSLFAADLFSSHWLFGDLAPVKNGAPWYYGGLPGIEHADYLLVPFCPVIHEVRSAILNDVKETPFILTELHRSKLYVLYGLEMPAQ